MSNIEAARNEWEAETTEESIGFALFPKQPQTLRRHSSIRGGLAALHFGNDKTKGQWIDRDDTVYLGMIVSEIEGDGTKLLSRIKRLADKYGLSIKGHPTPLKPTNWLLGRPFSYKQEILVSWYAKNGFEIMNDGGIPAIQYPPSRRM